MAPRTFHVSQNYPNPFNAGTLIETETTESGELTFAIYNSLGQLVDVILSRVDAGVIVFEWKPNNKYLSGVYYYRATLNEHSSSGKMILLK